MGIVFKAPAIIVYIAGGLWGLLLIWNYLTDQIGTFLTVMSFFILPIVFYLVPFYAGFVDGYWLPLWVNWGALIIAGTLFFIGEAVERK